MRKFLPVYLLIVIGLIFTASVNARIDPKTVAGAWLLDEGDDDEIAEDISGNENHGTLQGDPEWVDDGIFGSALSFNGTTARVVIPDADSLDLQEEWTISAWVFVNGSEGDYGHILGKRDDTVGGDELLLQSRPISHRLGGLLLERHMARYLESACCRKRRVGLYDGDL